MNNNRKPQAWRQDSSETLRRFAANFSTRHILVCFAGAVVIASLCIASQEYQARLQGREEIHALALRYEGLRHHVDSLQAVVAAIDQRVDLINQLAFGEMTAAEGQFPCEQVWFGGESAERPENTDVLSILSFNINSLQRKVFPDSIAHRDMLDRAKSRQKLYASIPAILPLAGHPMAALASGYGLRLHPFFHLIKMHQGIDFAAPQGTPVLATAEGEVIAADTAFVGYGTLVIVDHGHGYQTRYAHLGKFLVKPGDRVFQGQVIAYVGNTGQSTASHLHYEVLLQGVPINPVHFLFRDVKPVDYQKLVSLAFVQNQSLGN